MRIKRSHGDTVRIFFATDIHGSERCFRKWLNASPVYGTTVVVLGGDVAGKGVVPILEVQDRWEAKFLGNCYVARTEVELEDLRSRIRRGGSYDVLLKPSELEELQAEPAMAEKMIARVMSESLARWRALGEERFEERGLIGFMMLGNDDPPELERALEGGERLLYSGEQVVELPGGMELLSCGYSSPTPWASPRELTEPELEERIEALMENVRDPGRTIFNLHCPPHSTRLDQAPQLDDDLRPQASVSGIKMAPVGSTSVRAAIERYQPLLGLHGHVHESPGVERLGSTVCINPGSLYGQGVLRGAVIEVDVTRPEVRRWQLTEG